MKAPELECLFNKVTDLRSAAHRCFVMFCHAFQTWWISWNLNLENDAVRNVASLVLKKVRINKKWNSWENSCPKLFCKESVLKHSRENTCIRVSFLMKLIKFFYWKETTLQSLTPLPLPPLPPSSHHKGGGLTFSKLMDMGGIWKFLLEKGGGEGERQNRGGGV